MMKYFKCIERVRGGIKKELTSCKNALFFFFFGIIYDSK